MRAVTAVVDDSMQSRQGRPYTCRVTTAPRPTEFRQRPRGQHRACRADTGYRAQAGHGPEKPSVPTARQPTARQPTARQPTARLHCSPYRASAREAARAWSCPSFGPDQLDPGFGTGFRARAAPREPAHVSPWWLRRTVSAAAAGLGGGGALLCAAEVSVEGGGVARGVLEVR